MEEHEFWRERAGGDVYAVQLVDGLVAGAYGPLELHDIDERFLVTLDYDQGRAAWLEDHRDDFELYGTRPQTVVPVPPVHPAFADRLVSDVMHPGVMTCHSGSSLHEVARTLAAHGIHAVAVWGDEGEDSVGFGGMISDLDLVSAVARGESLASSAVAVARRDVVSVRASAELSEGARLMVQHRTTHLIVLADDRDRPVGVLSALDITRTLVGAP